MAKGKDKHRPSSPVVVPAVTESLFTLSEVKISQSVGQPVRIDVRYEVGDDTDPDNYKVVRAGTHVFVDTPGEDPDTDPSALEDYLHANAASSQTILENLNKVVYQLLADRGAIPAGSFE